MTTSDIAHPQPGLRVFEAPEDFLPASANQWLLTHHEGHILGAFETEAAANVAAERVASLADWTKSAMTAANQISLSLEGGATGFLRLLRELGADVRPTP